MARSPEDIKQQEREIRNAAFRKRNLDVSHIPEDSVFFRESDAEQRAWLMVDRLTKDTPLKLQKWLDAQGFDIIPAREVEKHVIDSRLRRAGVGKAATAWRKEAREELAKLGLKCLTPNVTKELVWRLVDTKMSDWQPEAKKKRAKVVEHPEETYDAVEGMEFLPEWMRWVVMHPGLLLTHEEVESDEVLRQKVLGYEKAFPCPHQAALNQFTLYRGDKKLLDGLFKEIAKLHQTVARKAEDTTAGDRTETEEQKNISTLEQLFANTEG